MVRIDKIFTFMSSCRWQCVDDDISSCIDKWFEDDEKKKKAQRRWTKVKKTWEAVARMKMKKTWETAVQMTRYYHESMQIESYRRDLDEEEQVELYTAKLEATGPCLEEEMGDDVVAPRPERPDKGPFGPEGIYPSDFEFKKIPCAEGTLFPGISTMTGKEPTFTRDSLMREVEKFLEMQGGEWKPAGAKWIVQKVSPT